MKIVYHATPFQPAKWWSFRPVMSEKDAYCCEQVGLAVRELTPTEEARFHAGTAKGQNMVYGDLSDFFFPLGEIVERKRPEVLCRCPRCGDISSYGKYKHLFFLKKEVDFECPVCRKRFSARG